MQSNKFEFFVGFLVLIFALCLGAFVVQSYSISKVRNYSILAKFERIDGVQIGSDVKINGIKIGEVKSVNLDLTTYKVNVGFTISQEYKIPIDSSAAIVSEGIMGGKYVSIIPGSEDENLLDGQFLISTQPPMNLESIIGQFLFQSKDNKAKD